MNQPGRLISFEGTDGSGKTTLGRHISEFLNAEGLATCHIEIPRLPGDSIVSKIRGITRSADNLHMAATTETFLYLASLAQRVSEYVVPNVERGAIVLADRFSLSVLVLAHYARRQPRGLVMRMVELATLGVQPDLIVLCDVEPSVAMERVLTRKQEEGRAPSRKEQEGESLLAVLRSGYLKEAKRRGDQAMIIPSHRLSLQEMQDIAEKRVRVLLAEALPPK